MKSFQKIVYQAFFLSVMFLSFIISTKNVFACDTLYCLPANLCDGECRDCYWCPTPIPQVQQDPTESIEGRIVNPVLPNKLSTMPGTIFLKNILKSGITLILIAGSVIFFFILTSGGLKWLSSSGDKVKLESAQKQISSGFVGLVILLSSFAIIKLIETLFGIDLLNITLPTL